MKPNDARILRGAAIFTAVAGLIAVVASGLVAGWSGAAGAGLGVLVAAGFFGPGLYVLSRVAHRWPELLFGAAFLIYTTQVVVLVVLMLVLRDASFLHGRAFATGVMTGMVAWLAGQIWSNLKVKTLYVDPEAASGASSGPEGRA
ncbi:hypothetical protein PJ985_08605 [Streptomyces sp. ACA25]|uniref:hypothetical protein n=1 Tax=Streptomyces sp. ACA25 TaxID=3022596 RepID=UPI002307AAFB|nr:hypothetical protein [Streptomyces sp. ACA25]MDB1087625.1 hypothetical protein [Streptomyces sp. ACA25]